MTKTNILMPLMALAILAVSCSEDEVTEPVMAGAPRMEIKTVATEAFFGDSVAFVVNVDDAQDIALSTLKAQLFYGDEMVSNTTIRTKAEGDYSGKILCPLITGVPDGTATLRFTLENITGAKATEDRGVALTHLEQEIVYSINGVFFEDDSETTSVADINVKQGDKIVIEGFDLNNFWIDPDFFAQSEDGSLSFNAIDGSYRVIADTRLNYFRIYALNGGSAATLNDDGSGALWIIGENVGKPNVNNAVGWTTENALCMAQISDKVHQITLVGGTMVGTDKINFKFFGQMGWGIELTGDKLTSTSDVVLVGDGVTGHDNGNLYIADGMSLETDAIYTFTVDMTAGINAAVLSVQKVE